jgi:UDP-3-O-[3-hydroxymyristoyl] glucosamine N-acyltransferase
MKLTELTRALGVELRTQISEIDVEVSRVAGVRHATGDAIVFAEDEASLVAAMASDAAAVITRASLSEAAGKPLLITSQPRLQFARAAKLLAPVTLAVQHQTAVIASTAHIGLGTSIGAGAVIGDDVTLGENCRIYPRVVIYPGTTIGNRVVIHAGAVLGADGFGYVRDAKTGEHTQFPQQGTLAIEDDVEIGANATIDRGALEETRIGAGTKIDNMVHIGHNVCVGRNVVIAAQTGISGSTIIGEGAIIGGQVGIGDHAEVGPGVILGSAAGLLPHKTLTGPGEVFWGTPAQPLKQYLRELAMMRRLSKRRKDEA